MRYAIMLPKKLVPALLCCLWSPVALGHRMQRPDITMLILSSAQSLGDRSGAACLSQLSRPESEFGSCEWIDPAGRTVVEEARLRQRRGNVGIKRRGCCVKTVT